MPPAFAIEVIQKVGEAIASASPSARKAFGPGTSCYVAGGEPCDDLSALSAVTATARQHGMFTQVVSAGYWAQDRCESCMDVLKEATDLLVISVSARRAREAGVGHVDTLIRAARARELPCSLQLVLDDGDDWPLDLVRLPILSEDSLMISVVPAASTYATIPESSALLLDQLPPRRCSELFGFMVVPNGDVYPCLPMVGIESMRIGNLRTDSIEEILTGVFTRPDLREYAQCGPGGLIPLAISQAKGDLLPRSYLDQCHFHWKYLADAELAALTRDWQPPDRS